MWCVKLKKALSRATYGQSRSVIFLSAVVIVSGMRTGRRVLREAGIQTDFPESILKAGEKFNAALQVASPVTWLGAGQKISCSTPLNAENLALKPQCQERGCEYHMVQPNGSYSELYFVGGSQWKDTSVQCIYFYYILQTYDDYPVFRHGERLIPVSVREPPEIIIEPSPTGVYRDQHAVVSCRAAIPYVPSTALQWLAFDSNGQRLDNVFSSLNMHHDPLVLRGTLLPNALAAVARLQCEAKLGGVEPFVYRRAVSSLFVVDPPTLMITPTDTTLVIGRTAVFTCSAKGYILGELQWVVDCRTCRFEQRSETYNTSDIYYPEMTRTFLTFAITKEWDGVTVSCQPGQYDQLAILKTLRAKRLPILSLIPSTLHVYNGQSVTVRCVGTYKLPPKWSNGSAELNGQLLDDRAPTLKWTVSNATTSPYTKDSIANAEMQNEIYQSRSGSVFTFTASQWWQNRIISCYSVTDDDRDAAATTVTVRVRVYKTPQIFIYPPRPAVLVEAETSILCVGHGLHMGRLQWIVDCTACDYRVQDMGGRVHSDIAGDISNISTDAPVTNELVLVIRPSTSWQRIVAECTVMGTHGLPVNAVRVKVEDKPLTKALQYAAIPIGTAVMFFIVLIITRKVIAKRQSG